MELRLSGDEEKNAAGAGMGFSEREADSMSLGTYKEESNPWDFDLDEKPYVVKSISSTIDTVNIEETDVEKPTALMIGKVLMYVAFLIMFLTVLQLCTKNQVNLMMNLLKSTGLLLVPVILVLVDVIIVNKCAKKNYLLYIFWWFAFPIYPIMRNKHTDGRVGASFLCTVIYIVSMVLVFITSFKAGGKYGAIVEVLDEQARMQAAVIMDYKLADGRRLGDRIMDEFYVENVGYEIDGQTTYVMLEGDGGMKLEGDSFVFNGVSSVHTQLIFYKTGDTEYKLGAVRLGSQLLTDVETSAYWNNVILQ